MHPIASPYKRTIARWYSNERLWWWESIYYVPVCMPARSYALHDARTIRGKKWERENQRNLIVNRISTCAFRCVSVYLWVCVVVELNTCAHTHKDPYVQWEQKTSAVGSQQRRRRRRRIFFHCHLLCVSQARISHSFDLCPSAGC